MKRIDEVKLNNKEQLKRVAVLMFKDSNAINDGNIQQVYKLIYEAIDAGKNLNDLVLSCKLYHEQPDQQKLKVQTMVLQAMLEDPECPATHEMIQSLFKEQKLKAYDIALLYGYHELLPDLELLGCHEGCAERLARAGYPKKENLIEIWRTGEGRAFLSAYQTIDRLVGLGLGSREEVKLVMQYESNPEKFLRQCQDFGKRGLTKLEVAIYNNASRLAYALASHDKELDIDVLEGILKASRKRLIDAQFMTNLSDLSAALLSYRREPKPLVKKEDAKETSSVTAAEQTTPVQPLPLSSAVKPLPTVPLSKAVKPLPKFGDTGMGYLAMLGDGNCQFHTVLKGIQIAFKDNPKHPIHRMDHLELRRALADYIDERWADDDKNWGMFISVHFEEIIRQNSMGGLPASLMKVLNYFAYGVRLAKFLDPEELFGLQKLVETELQAFLDPSHFAALVGLYTDALRQPRTWGNDMELAALSKMFGVQFFKHQVTHDKKPVGSPFEMGGEGPSIHLAYDGGHYDLILPPEQALKAGYQVGFARSTPSQVDMSLLLQRSLSDLKLKGLLDKKPSSPETSKSPSTSSEEQEETLKIKKEPVALNDAQTPKSSDGKQEVISPCPSPVASPEPSPPSSPISTPKRASLSHSTVEFGEFVGFASEATTTLQHLQSSVDHTQGGCSPMRISPISSVSSSPSLTDASKMQLDQTNPFAFEAQTSRGAGNTDSLNPLLSYELQKQAHLALSYAGMPTSDTQFMRSELEHLFKEIKRLVNLTDIEAQEVGILGIPDETLRNEVQLLAIRKRHTPLLGQGLDEAIRDVLETYQIACMEEGQTSILRADKV